MLCQSMAPISPISDSLFHRPDQRDFSQKALENKNDAITITWTTAHAQGSKSIWFRPQTYIRIWGDETRVQNIFLLALAGS